MSEKQVATVWDTKVQQYHGGQEWQKLANFIEDFSVTTNGLGTPVKAKEKAREAVDLIDHYPPADQEPARSHLAGFLWPQNPEQHGRLLLGNGASELIDLVIRDCKPGPWKSAPWKTQYKEYERSARNTKRDLVAHDDKSAVLTCLVNPNNPTGDYLNIEEMKRYIESTTAPGATVLVDESMQLWVGPHWREDSLVGQSEWVAKLYAEKQISVWVIHSWTKIWSCTGLRLGSIVAPRAEDIQRLKKAQVPWSVNQMALAFLSEVVRDDAYMNETWRVTTEWRRNTTELLNKHFPTWVVYGHKFLSWLWIDTKDAAITERAVTLAKEAGIPVRSGAHGYEMPTFLRIAARAPERTAILFKAWEPIYQQS